jgi:hypothetical protein
MAIDPGSRRFYPFVTNVDVGHGPTPTNGVLTWTTENGGHLFIQVFGDGESLDDIIDAEFGTAEEWATISGTTAASS